jgi:predicted MFS family arabinose efflux permease
LQISPGGHETDTALPDHDAMYSAANLGLRAKIQNRRIRKETVTMDSQTTKAGAAAGSIPPNNSGKRPAVANDAAAAGSRMRRRVVLASILGNGLEWFDFVSYGYFASIIAKVFFPAGSDLALMLTYATFAVGFVVRPVGGIVLGAYADRYGRRRALSLLIVMMAFGTLTLGLTPAYATIGIVAPIIVVLGRVVQGISIGGEFASATALWWSSRRPTSG